MSILSSTAVAATVNRFTAEFRRCAVALGYDRKATDAALLWVEERGVIDGCPVIEREDWEALGLLIRRHEAAEADAQPYGTFEGHPSTWPTWCDFHVYEPTDADRLFVASEGAVNLFDGVADFSALDARALESLTAGCFPADVSLLDLPPISGGSPDADRPAFRPWTPDECKAVDDRERFGSHGYDDRAGDDA